MKTVNVFNSWLSLCDLCVCSLNQNPNITHISPRKGPMSGGTRVTAVGMNLDFGSAVEILVGPDSAKAEIVW